MSKYAIYEMFGGRDAPYNVESFGHLVGSCIWDGDDDPTALMARAHARDMWHTEPPKDGRLVLCQGKRGSIFVGSLYEVNKYGMEFYVPNCRDNYRYAIAWHELPRAYRGGGNGTD